MYSVFRRFYKAGDSVIFTENVAVFSDLDKANEFLHSEKDSSDHSYKHIDTYIVDFELGKVYNNIQALSSVHRKYFNTV